MEFFAGFFDQMGDLVAQLVIPSDTYFDSKLGSLQETLNSKFNLDSLDIQFDSVIQPQEPAKIPFLYGTYIDFGWFTPYIDNVHTAVSALLILSTFMYLLKHIRGFFS